MSTKTYSVRSPVFDTETGKVLSFNVWCNNNAGLIHVVRNGKEIELTGSTLSLSAESKLRRLIKEYDKLGKRSIGL